MVASMDVQVLLRLRPYPREAEALPPEGGIGSCEVHPQSQQHVIDVSFLGPCQHWCDVHRVLVSPLWPTISNE